VAVVSPVLGLLQESLSSGMTWASFARNAQRNGHKTTMAESGISPAECTSAYENAFVIVQRKSGEAETARHTVVCLSG
jgi:hypothetical protein